MLSFCQIFAGHRMKFVHLSDLHFTTTAEEYPALRPGLVNALGKVFDDVAKIEKHLDFVSITGDLAERGNIESYEGLKKLLNAMSIPVFIVPGNHDNRDDLRRVFASAYYFTSNDPMDYQVDFGRVQVLGVDTVIEGKPSGRISDDQLSWLRSMLLHDYTDHTVVSMHHPPFPTGHAEFDEMAEVEGAEELGELIRRSKSKVVVLSGHVHRPYQTVWHGANCYIAGGPSFQMGSSFCFGDSRLQVVEEPFAYFIHAIDSQGTHSVGTRYVSLDVGEPRTERQKAVGQ